MTRSIRSARWGDGFHPVAERTDSQVTTGGRDEIGRTERGHSLGRLCDSARGAVSQAGWPSLWQRPSDRKRCAKSLWLLTFRREDEQIPDTSSGFGLECETNVQHVPLGMHVVHSEPVKLAGWNRRADGTTKPSRTSWSTVENDRRQMRSGQIINSSGPDPNPALPCEGANSEPLLD